MCNVQQQRRQNLKLVVVVLFVAQVSLQHSSEGMGGLNVTVSEGREFHCFGAQ